MLVLLTLLSLAVTCSRSLSLPSQTVNAGSELVLACSLTSQQGGHCHWLKDGWVLDLGDGRRRARRDCELVISPVLPLDQGQYQCQVGGSSPLKSPAVVLSVNTEPSQPEIQQGDKMMVETGDTLELSCQAGGAKPAADIQWWNVETGRRIEAEVTQHVERTGGETFKTTSILSLSPSEYTEVFCTAHSQAFPTNLKSIPLEISIRDKPRVESLELSQGDSVKLLCQNNAVEQSVKWKWFINENQISGEESDMLEITKFAQIYDKTVIKCARENVDGEDEILRIVRLVYNPDKLLSVLPTPTVPTLSSLAKKKKKQTFLCVSSIEEATEPKHVWIEGNHGKHQHSPYNFVSKDKKYKCREVRNGAKNMVDISRELTFMNRKLKKFSRHLDEIYS